MSDQIKSLAKQFNFLFSGLQRAHTRYVLKEGKDDRGKTLGEYRTIRQPLTPDIWEQHLAGTYHAGVCPIRDDATVVFGAVDIDSYKDFDLKALAKKVSDLNIPLIVTRTKSGGAHCYLFCREPIPADIVRTKLMEFAEALGYSGVEVYPKQTRLAGPNDFGNVLNLPYFDVTKTERYGVMPDENLSAAAYLKTAALMAVTRDSLAAINLNDDPRFVEQLKGAPPCLRTLVARGGIPEGARNNGLFDIGVYLRKRYGENWETYFDQYNQDFVNPPLGSKEVQMLTRSINKTKYEYKCGDSPINSVCNRQICLTREFGIGAGDSDPGVAFGPLVKLNTEPPLWIWDVDGERIELTTEQLKDQGRAHTRIIEVLNKWPFPIKPKAWMELIREKLASVEVQEVPPEATLETQVMAILEQYCTGKAQAKTPDEMLQDKPWTDKIDNRTYFRGIGFKQELGRQHIQIDDRKLWAIMRRHGVGHKFFNLKGKGVNMWWIPAFKQQTEDFKVPRLQEAM
jgi:hypothetical protein